jgi:hypothetical protein
MSTPATNYAPIIYLTTLVVAGVALSYIRFREIIRRHSPIPILYATSIISTTTYSYLQLIMYLFPGNPTVILALSTIQCIVDAITGVTLESCYILRFYSCVRMSPRRRLVYVLFIFPFVYIITDILAIIALFDDTFIVSQASYGMFNFVLMVGGIITHCSTIVILLRNSGNLKDKKEKVELKVVAVLAIANQICFLVFCCLCFNEVVYSTSLVYLSWTTDHIVFSLVNRHIRSFLLSTNQSDPDDSSNSKVTSEREPDSQVSKTARDHSMVAVAHEKFSTMNETETV